MTTYGRPPPSSYPEMFSILAPQCPIPSVSSLYLYKPLAPDLLRSYETSLEGSPMTITIIIRNGRAGGGAAEAEEGMHVARDISRHLMNILLEVGEYLYARILGLEIALIGTDQIFASRSQSIFHGIQFPTSFVRIWRTFYGSESASASRKPVTTIMGAMESTTFVIGGFQTIRSSLSMQTAPCRLVATQASSPSRTTFLDQHPTLVYSSQSFLSVKLLSMAISYFRVQIRVRPSHQRSRGVRRAQHFE